MKCSPRRGAKRDRGVIEPWSAHRGILYFGGGEFVLVPKNGSRNLYIGNAYDATGTYARPPSMWNVVFKENANEADIDWTPHLLVSIREHPWSLPRLLWTKTKLFWQSGEVPHIANFF